MNDRHSPAHRAGQVSQVSWPLVIAGVVGLAVVGGGVFLVLVAAMVAGSGDGRPTQQGVAPGGNPGAPAAQGNPGAGLEGTYRRRYDDAAGGVGKSDSITFTADGRFTERGFLNAALGGQVVGNQYVFFDERAGGQGTYRVSGATLELTYSTGETFRINCYASGRGGQMELILNTYYTFVRIR